MRVSATTDGHNPSSRRDAPEGHPLSRITVRHVTLKLRGWRCPIEHVIRKIKECRVLLLLAAIGVIPTLLACDWELCTDCAADDDWDPLVLSFDGRTPLIHPNDAEFDIGDGSQCRTDWPDAATPWLVYDLDGNGEIDGGHELFGTTMRMPDGTFVENGFVALAVLDEDGDGWITNQDSAWPLLALWSDHDGDRRSSPGELQSLDATGIIGVSLDYVEDPRCDDRGNCALERAPFLWSSSDGATQVGAAIDLHLACR
jgi:hypothetical protein